MVIFWSPQLDAGIYIQRVLAANIHQYLRIIHEIVCIVLCLFESSKIFAVFIVIITVALSIAENVHIILSYNVQIIIIIIVTNISRAPFLTRAHSVLYNY